MKKPEALSQLGLTLFLGERGYPLTPGLLLLVMARCVPAPYP